MKDRYKRWVWAGTGLAIGLMAIFPRDAAYLFKKAAKLQLYNGLHTIYTRATCSEKAKDLDQLVQEHRQYHKEAVRRNIYSIGKKTYMVDTRLLIAIESAESDGISCAVSRKYARGPRQLTDETIQRYGVKNPFNIQENRDGSDAFFVDLMRTYEGRTRLAVASYNAGPKRVYNTITAHKEEVAKRIRDETKKRRKILSGEDFDMIIYEVVRRYLPIETSDFVSKVMKKYDFLKRAYNENLERVMPVPRPQIRKKTQNNPEFKIAHRPSYLTHPGVA